MVVVSSDHSSVLQLNCQADRGPGSHLEPLGGAGTFAESLRAPLAYAAIQIMLFLLL